jgi:hypothetical protein
MDALEKAILIEKAKEYAEGYDALRRHVEVLEERLSKVEDENRRHRNNHYRQRQGRSQLQNSAASATIEASEKLNR